MRTDNRLRHGLNVRRRKTKTYQIHSSANSNEEKTNKCIKISQYKSKLFCSPWKEKIYEMQQNIKWKRRKCWCIKMKESLKIRGNDQPSIPSLCLSVTPSSVLEDQVLLQTGSLISVSGFVWCSPGLIQPRSPMSLSTGGGTLGKTVEPVPAVR